MGPEGSLGYLGEEWTRGDYPRSFNFDRTGRFPCSLNQRAGHAVFRVDPEPGGLEFTGFHAPVGNLSTIAFLDLDAGSGLRT